MLKALAICIVLSITVHGDRAFGQLISTERRIAWDPGVRGGIPSRSTTCANVRNAPYSAKGDGSADDASAIQTAIDTCPYGQVVVLPAGVYRITFPIRVRSGVTLRGEGDGKTVIKGSKGFTHKWLIGFEDPAFDWSLVRSPARDLVGSISKGSTSIQTAMPHDWRLGDILLVDQLENAGGDPPITNDGNSGQCTWCGRMSGNRPIGQWVRVTAVSSPTTVTIEPPLHWVYPASRSPQAVRVSGITEWAGIEDLAVDNSDSAARDTVFMHFAVNCWLIRLDLVGSYRRHVDVYGGLWNTIRGNTFREGVPAVPIVGSHYGPDRAYGVFLGPWPTATLVEDNIFVHLSIGVALEGAPSGNVVAYNYFTDFYYTDPDWQRTAIGHHGAHPMMNLLEGNVVAGLSISADFYWGSSSHTTLFRNRVTNTTKSCGTWAIDLYQKAHYFNMLGNVLGAGTDNTYELEGVTFAYCNGPASARAIYKLGYVGGGDADGAGNDAGVKKTLFRHGNWDGVTNTVVWNATISERTLPSSLYLPAVPAWWGSLRWPAIGPDLSPPAEPIPAQVRFSRNAAPLPTPQNLRVLSR